MGHRLSKSNTTPSQSSQPPNTQSSTTESSSSTTTSSAAAINQRQANDRNSINLNVQDIINSPAAATSHITSIDVTASNTTTTTTIAAGNSSDNQNFHIESTTVTVPAQAAARRFIIKIQLTKMEPGSSPDDPTTMTTMTTSVALDGNDNGNHAADNLDNNLNVTRPILNLTFMKNIECDSSNEIVIESNEEIKLNNLNAISEHRNSGTSISSNFVNNFATAPFIDEDGNEMQINRNASPPNGIWSRRLSGSNRSSPCSEDSHDVPEINQKMPECSLVGASSTMCGEGDKNHCCRRKKSSSYPSKWRCCKCVCRTCRTSPTHSKESTPTRDDSNSNSSTPSPSSNPNNINNNTNNNNNNNRTANTNNCAKQDITVHSSDLAMWVPPENILQNPETGQLHRVLPHFNISPELVLVTLNYPQSILMGPVEDCDERARRLRAIEIETGVDPTSAEFGSPFASMLSSQKHWPHFMCSPTPGFGPVVHSQVDYIHCLVPDLDKITNSSFYWGKMDRYEAERLLEGKPEGTFLLRDSAQEEYLFSVTFRKYGRSLHARIEQFNHKFSFDCHDPGVFTATTVTGLLEHYKDPSCVMFFEPMLTIPLHRNFTFSLQQLCRATIASNITYDGVNELQLPNSLKSYLKEYYYKLRVRVKPFDEPFYSCS